MGSCRQKIHNARRPTMKKLVKKEKVVHSEASDDSSFLDGSTTPQGFTAGGKTHLCGNYMGAGGTQSMSTRHQTPVSFTRHQSTRHRASRHLSTSHQATYHSAIRHQATRHRSTRHQVIYHRAARHQATRYWSTRHQETICRSSDTRHQSLVTRYGSSRHGSSSGLSGTGHQSPGTVIQSSGTSQQATSHRAPGTSQFTRHRTSGNNSLALNTGCPVILIRVLSIHY